MDSQVLSPDVHQAEFRARYALGMPQMLLGGLSERWLLKEAGDIHWRMVCGDLGVPSGKLTGDEGERLYASFMRIRMESSVPLSCYGENEVLEHASELSRFGDKRFFTAQTFRGASGEVRVEMATVFVSRESDNKSLARATPQQLVHSRCHSHPVLPPFGQGFQKLRRVAFEETAPVGAVVQLGGVDFDWSDHSLDTRGYVVNPYYDLNGVGLLYFASYPRIHDVCEAHYLNEQLRRAGLAGEAAMQLGPVARDTYYFGNADAGDELELRLRRIERLAGDRLRIWSTLFRQRDGVRIADQFVVKALAAPDCALASVIAAGKQEQS